MLAIKKLKKCLGFLYITGGKSKIGHHIIKVVNAKIGWIIWYIDHEAINKTAEYKVLLNLEHGKTLWYKLKKMKGDNPNGQ